MVWYRGLAHLPGVKDLVAQRTRGVAFREDKPGWRLGEMEWVAPHASVTTAPVICCTVRLWSEEVDECDWAVSVWQADSFYQQYTSHTSKNSNTILQRHWFTQAEKTYFLTNRCSVFVNHSPEDWLICIGIYSSSRPTAQQWRVLLWNDRYHGVWRPSRIRECTRGHCDSCQLGVLPPSSLDWGPDLDSLALSDWIFAFQSIQRETIIAK